MNSSSEVTNELYAGLSDDLRHELAEHGRVVTVPQGTRLLQCGISPDHLIILNSGSTEISLLGTGKTRSLGVARPGKVFALHSIISGEAPHTSVTCLEECRVTLVPRETFLDVLQRNPQMYLAVVKVLSSDLAAAQRVIRRYARGSATKAQPECFKPS